MRKKLLFIIGTRPELIKMFPIINYLKTINYNDYRIVSTGQHKDLLEPYWNVFNLNPDYKLDIIKEGQNLTQLTSRAIIALDELINDKIENFKPDVILAQGDTTTVMAASMVAFYHKIEFGHVEAGLRSFDMHHPFPEEYNRRIASLSTKYHFAPTNISKENLLNENINEKNIFTVGNSVIDTLHYFINSNQIDKHTYINSKLRGLDEKNVLITCHRRENHDYLENLIEAIDELSEEYSDLNFIWPVHPNPNVKNKVLNSSLKYKGNVFITEPLEYLDLIKVIATSEKIISDSGGIQEEAPTFKKAVLILRETTERPEAVDNGLSILVGMNKNNILDAFKNFKPNFSSSNTNPYGDGNTSKRIIDILFDDQLNI